MIYRHGDLLIRPVKLNKTGKKVKDIKLALGEFTGHSHKLNGTVSVIEGVDGAVKYFSIEEPTTLTHEEHKPIGLEPDTYEVIVEKEYDYFTKEVAKVQD